MTFKPNPIQTFARQLAMDMAIGGLRTDPSANALNHSRAGETKVDDPELVGIVDSAILVLERKFGGDFDKFDQIRTQVTAPVRTANGDVVAATKNWLDGYAMLA